MTMFEYMHDPNARDGTTHGDKNVSRLERWLSSLGGAALILSGLKRRSWGGLLLSVGGAALALRGMTGRCGLYRRLGINTASPEASKQVEVQSVVTIQRPAQDIYRFWRRLENLPTFMKHLTSVTETSERVSHWVAREGTFRIEWDAEITEDTENQFIAWRALPGGDVYTAGRVDFEEAPDGHATEVQVRLGFAPPAGIVGRALSPFLYRLTSKQIDQELQRLKRMMESGEARAMAIEERSAEVAGAGIPVTGGPTPTPNHRNVHHTPARPES